VRGIAVIGGECPDAETLRKIARAADVLVAADSGLVACENAGLVPDWIVGDMDSLDDERRLEKYPADRILRSPVAKDFTDTELALNLLKEQGCGEVWLAGGGGGRIDHLLAIRSIFERDNPPEHWFPGGVEIRCLMEGGIFRATLAVGSIVSVFPLGDAPWQAESSSLKWQLDGIGWDRGSAYISNIAVSPEVEIRAARGRFMVITPVSIG